MLKVEGELGAAKAAFDQSLSIIRRLATQDPSNADWQRHLALACFHAANIEANAGRNSTALPLYEESLGIFATLIERAPGFVQWEEDLSLVETELTALRGKIAAAPEGRG